MNIGPQLILWRKHRSLGQQSLADQADVTRAYLSRLEGGKGDPSLSVLRKLSAALGITVGALVETVPPRSSFTREELDQLARAIYHPNRKENQKLPHIKILARAYQHRRSALGLTRAKPQMTNGRSAIHRVRVLLGEDTWHALLKRIDKHAPFQKKDSL